MHRRTSALVAALLVTACGADRTQPVPPSHAADVTSSGTLLSPSRSASTTTETSPPAAESATPRRAPTLDTWAKAGELNDFRVVTRLALLGTGEVLVVGADNVCGAVSDGSDTAEVGDPVARTWRRTASLPSRRQEAVLVSLPDGRALVTAG